MPENPHATEALRDPIVLFPCGPIGSVAKGEGLAETGEGKLFSVLPVMVLGCEDWQIFPVLRAALPAIICGKCGM